MREYNGLKKVLLLNPFNDICYGKNEEGKTNGHLYAEAPLGQAYIYTFFKKNIKDIDISILDGHALMIEYADNGMEYCWDLLLDKIVDINPSIIGIGAYFLKSAGLFHETCKKIKERLPNTIIVSGGNYATIVPEVILEDKNVDYALLSEGEYSFTEFAKAYFEGADLTKIDGLAFRKYNDSIHINKKNHYISDLSTLPIPDRSVLPMHLYGKGRCVLDRLYGPGNYRLHSLSISRGCPYSCGFCTSTIFWNRKIRYRDTKSVLDEMQMLKESYGATALAINDDNFLVNKEKASAIMHGMIDRDLNLKWYIAGGTSARAFNDDKFLDLAIRSGYAYFNLAIESGSDDTLKRINKQLTIGEVRQLVKKVRERYPHMWINGFFIVGFPFETKNDIMNTLKFSQELELDWCSHYIFQAIPGSPLYEYCIEKGIIENLKFDYTKGDLFNESSVYGDDWTSKWAFETNYEYNLRVNFLNNRNLKYGKYEQALRDFEYIISMVPGHALAYRQAATAAGGMGNAEKHELYLNREKELLISGGEFTKWYQKLGLDIE